MDWHSGCVLVAVINSRVLPASGDNSPRDSDSNQHQQQIDRIRNELAGFRPIPNAKSTPLLTASASRVTSKTLTSSKRGDSSRFTSSVTSLGKKSFQRTSSKAHDYY